MGSVGSGYRPGSHTELWNGDGRKRVRRMDTPSKSFRRAHNTEAKSAWLVTSTTRREALVQLKIALRTAVRSANLMNSYEM